MYDLAISDVQNLSDTLEEINRIGAKIVTSFYAADTQQVVIIVESKEEEKPKLTLFDKEENEEA